MPAATATGAAGTAAAGGTEEDDDEDGAVEEDEDADEADVLLSTLTTPCRCLNPSSRWSGAGLPVTVVEGLTE